jgi:hypothetical protein
MSVLDPDSELGTNREHQAGTEPHSLSNCAASSAAEATDEAVRFLRQLRPSGPWHVSFADPTGASGFRTEELTDHGALRGLIKRWNGTRNFYYAVNVWRPGLTKKASKEDVIWVTFVQADLDPMEGETPDDAKVRYRAALDAFVQRFGLRPTVEVDSGNGVQALWRLKTSVKPEMFARVEGISRTIMVLLGSADTTCHNVDRVFRIPGTRNLPTKKKLEKGRTTCEAGLVRFGDESYDLTDFDPVLAAAREHGAKPKANGAGVAEAGKAKQRRRRCSGSDQERLDEIVGGDGKSYPSRSEWLWAVIGVMARQGRDDGEIVAFILGLDATHSISGHIAEQGDADAYVARQVAQYRAEAAKQEAEETASLAPVAAAYPLPKLTAVSLIYKRRWDGEVWVHKVEGERAVPVASPFGVTARLRFMDQADAYGLRLVVEGMDKRPREIDMDRAALAKMGGTEIKAALLAAGLRAERDGEQIALQCLKAADPERETLIVRKPGWHRVEGVDHPIFVCPDGEVIGAPAGLALELSVAARIPASVARGGTLEGWRAATAAAIGVKDCPHWTFGVVSGFAGPLVSLTGLDTIGLNVSGLSTSGKTTAQKLGVSVWSRAASHVRDSLLQSARTTVNAAESAAARANGTILALDELAHVSGKELAKVIYMLAGNVGKRRMAADGATRERHSWSTFVLLSSELSLEEKITADGGEWTAGMAARIPDVDVTGVNRQVDRHILDRIEAIDVHFGRAGPAFVRELIAAGLHQRPGDLRATILEHAIRIAGQEADSATRRAAQPFAVVLTAGKLAQSLGLFPDTADVDETVRWAWDRFKQSSDAVALDPEEQAISAIRAYIAERWGASIQRVDDEQRPRDAVGWYDDTTVYLPTARLREAADGTLKESEVAKALAAKGLLTKTKDNKRRYVEYVPKIGHVKAYALRRPEFGRSDEF